MRRRPLALVLTAALIGAVFTALPAEAATEVPATVQIEDPINDANFLNDQDNITPIGHPTGDNPTPADPSTVTDYIKIWFSHTTDKVSVHFLTQAPAPATTTVYYRLSASPAEGDARGCLNFRTIIGGQQAQAGDTSTYLADDFAEFEDTCNAADTLVDGEISLETLEDGTGITTLTFPRSASPLLADGQTITGAYAVSRLAAGTARDNWASAAQSDNTMRGSDYLLDAVDGGEPPVVDEPDEPKPAKNPCKKLKGKKKKKCLKKHASKPCTAYTPGEKGAEAETSVVTDAATAEAPVEVPLTMDPSVGAFSGEVQGQANPLVSHAIQNVQVDSNAADSGLYVRVEFPEGEDYDLYLFDAEGNDAAHAGGGNQAPEELGDGTGNGGHSETTAEQLDGVKTADCGGYTVDVANAIGMGEATLKFWLGPATWDPATQTPIEPGSSKAFVF